MIPHDPACPVCRKPLESPPGPGGPRACPEGHGIWIEKVEDAPEGKPVDAPENPLPCPRGCGPMAVLDLGPFEVDRCGTCGGWWLDPAEIDALESLRRSGALGILGLAGFAASLPERSVRAIVGLLGGAVREGGGLLLPGFLKRTKLYDMIFNRSLRFFVEDVGGVEGVYEPGAPDAAGAKFVARKAISNLMEAAGIAAFHASPILVLAVVSDITAGARSYWGELGRELQRKGLADPKAEISTLESFLGSVGDFSGSVADAFDLPPLDPKSLREQVARIRDEAVRLKDHVRIDPPDIGRLWDDMREIATNEDRSLLEVSSAIAMGALGRAGKAGQAVLTGAGVGARMAYENLFGYYRDSIAEIHRKGYYFYLSERARPYVRAALRHLQRSNPSWTEKFLRTALDLGWAKRLLGKIF
ncbi:MAG: zf-TFIIB domain-containing protein [Planctomycetes bacterium]|nr:zf-TFIIB domain-containing protein [Planctomycetota bacterium]